VRGVAGAGRGGGLKRLSSSSWISFSIEGFIALRRNPSESESRRSF
jgi:hypothetical protein